MVEVIESVQSIDDSKPLASLDMGGTLVEDKEQTPTYKRINKAFGLSEQEDYRLYKEYENSIGDLSNHYRHARKQTRMLRGRPDANVEVYSKTIQQILKDREILEGAHNFIQKLDENNCGTMIVSAAPPAATLPFAEDLEADYLYKWKDLEFTDEGYFDQLWVNKEAPKGKDQIVKGVQDLGIEVGHFGNGGNDVAAVNTADAGLKQWWHPDPETAFENAFKEAKNLWR